MVLESVESVHLSAIAISRLVFVSLTLIEIIFIFIF